MNKNKKTIARKLKTAHAMGVVGGAVMAMAALPAAAFTIDTGNPDLTMRWDNTLKYNIGWRMEGRDNTLGDTAGFSTSTYSRDKGDVVTNRVDILTEFDMVYKENHGFRVSAAGWNDFDYEDRVRGNPDLERLGVNSPYPNNKFTSDVERYYERSGEILDAFVFTRADIGQVPLSLRAGRHNVYWGESLFSFGDSIAYGQGPLDLRKATSTPGIEAKELFLPQNQLSAIAQINEKITLAANYYLEWDPHRFPDGGTYLGASDVSLLGGQNLGVPYVGDVDGGRNKTPDDKGSFGINAQIQSDTLGGNVGLYYRKFDDRMPNVVFDPAGFLYNDYAEDVKLYGISYNRLIGSISVGAEVSRREDAALVGNARGDTWHALVNMIAYVGKTPLFHSAPLQAELTYSRLDKVTDETKAVFAHEDYACNVGTKGGCATDDAWGMNVSFTPTWYQVFPGIDVTLPLNYGIGLSGNSSAPLGTAENAGSWSVGVGLDIHSRVKVNLAYNDYFGEGVTGPNAFAGNPGIGDTQLNAFSGSETLNDRGWLSLTAKATF
ncbi:hypothetical protein D3C78_450930 [compost metagenome]